MWKSTPELLLALSILSMMYVGMSMCVSLSWRFIHESIFRSSFIVHITYVHQKMWSPRFSPDYRTRVSSLPYACTVISIITVILCQYAYTIIDAFLNKSIGKWFEKKRQREKISWTIAESDSKMHGIGNVEAAISQNVNEDETTTTIRVMMTMRMVMMVTIILNKRRRRNRTRTREQIINTSNVSTLLHSLNISSLCATRNNSDYDSIKVFFFSPSSECIYLHSLLSL